MSGKSAKEFARRAELDENRAERARIDEQIAKLESDMRSVGVTTSKGLAIKAKISRLRADKAALPVKRPNRRER